ncbi:b(0+)-type amino acid transporter 1 [Dissostichus eleginoides]|uniref:B(0+)-type amino acid transporter 1 n=1 Tax=Dissostichus eleginoides TaxID=100907 RepID=A0AAD9C587_DISEL|nr:b(0+)-type amino acid transporter 1 [Dissostichus eleginoides]
MRPASATGIALSFAEYVVTPFYSGSTPPQSVVKCVAAAAILGLTIVNCVSVRMATGIQVVSMVFKLVALAVIILGGVVMLFQGHTENFEEPFENTKADVSSIGIAFYQGLWSFGGVEHFELKLRN